LSNVENERLESLEPVALTVAQLLWSPGRHAARAPHAWQLWLIAGMLGSESASSL